MYQAAKISTIWGKDSCVNRTWMADLIKTFFFSRKASDEATRQSSTAATTQNRPKPKAGKYFNLRWWRKLPCTARCHSATFWHSCPTVYIFHELIKHSTRFPGKHSKHFAKASSELRQLSVDAVASISPSGEKATHITCLASMTVIHDDIAWNA